MSRKLKKCCCCSDVAEYKHHFGDPSRDAWFCYEDRCSECEWIGEVEER